MSVSRYDLWYKMLVSKWERGEVRPSGPSLKLLALANAKGIDTIL